MNEIKIFEVCEPRDEYVDAINRLLSQLSLSPHTFTVDNLKKLVVHEGTHLFLLQADDYIGAMLTLCITHCPTGCKMWIEDVVVDESLRGHSLGRKLVEHAMEYVRCNHPHATLMLTSRPSRVAANALYRAAGFSPKETNVYSMKFDE